MSPRPRSAYAVALATALAGATGVTSPMPVDADELDEPVIQRCYTQALSPAQAQAGATSTYDCVEVSADAPMPRADIVIAINYEYQNGGGDQMVVMYPSCTGAHVNMTSSDPWNNRISSIDLISCGSAKHWSGANYTGSNQLKSGTGSHNITGLMDDATSSIQYA